jgi:hypothetical protein
MKGLTHRFKVGQAVDLIPSTSRLAANGQCQIVSLRPADGEIPQYRIRVDMSLTNAWLRRTISYWRQT